MTTDLITPGLEHLPDYAAALERGWSADNLRGRSAAEEELALIATDPAGFLAGLDDPLGLGPPIPLADGRTMRRLPGLRRWIWDEGFCGVVGLRWQPGTAALPPHVMGHIGYAVVPWRAGQGHASAGLALMLPVARGLGLPYVELTAQETNPASIRVIEKNGGRLVERFAEPIHHGGAEVLRFRIEL